MNMKKMIISLAATFLLAMAVLVNPLPLAAEAQTRNQTSKFQITESFTFPNECTSELMDLTTISTITCHDQQRADGTFIEKCEIRQDVSATGETTGLSFHGSATFKDEFTATDNCNFSFSNRGRVRLITQGSDVNAMVTFDDVVRMENCVFTAGQHLVSFDCRGAGNP
jgi:hypothetical protein